MSFLLSVIFFPKSHFSKNSFRYTISVEQFGHRSVQLASYLEGGPLMWMMPLHLHVNQKSDYDDMMIRSDVLSGLIWV